MFIQDALELLDREDESFLEHDLLTSHMLERCPANQRHVLKLMGNIVIPGKHVMKI